MVDGVAFCDGKFVPVGEAKISILDPAFTRSDVVYDTATVWKGLFFRLDDHVARFFRSCEAMRLTPPHGAEEIKAILAECVDRAGLDDAYVQFVCTNTPPLTNITIVKINTADVALTSLKNGQIDYIDSNTGLSSVFSQINSGAKAHTYYGYSWQELGLNQGSAIWGINPVDPINYYQPTSTTQVTSTSLITTTTTNTFPPVTSTTNTSPPLTSTSNTSSSPTSTFNTSDSQLPASDSSLIMITDLPFSDPLIICVAISTVIAFSFGIRKKKI